MRNKSTINARDIGLLMEMYERWSEDPRSVDPNWSAFFEGYELGMASGAGMVPPMARHQPESPEPEMTEHPVAPTAVLGEPGISARRRSLTTGFLVTLAGVAGAFIVISLGPITLTAASFMVVITMGLVFFAMGSTMPE